MIRPVTLLNLLLLLANCSEPAGPDKGCPPGYILGGPDSTDCISNMSDRVQTWEVDTIGSYVSVLGDVTVIADDDIWAVGSLGGWGEVPEIWSNNALHWNGQEWEPVWIKYLHLSTTQADSPYGLYRVTAVHAIRADAVWAAGLTPYFYDGETWTSYQIENSNWSYGAEYINDIWARNENDVYFVGARGNIRHWDGTDFAGIDLGTEYDLVNVTGSEDRIYITAMNGNYDGTRVYEFADGQWNKLLESFAKDADPANQEWGGIYSGQVLADTAYFGTGTGLLKYAYKAGTFNLVPVSEIGIPFYTIEEVAVLAPNDIHLFNFDNRYYHFNGLDWKRYDKHFETGFRYKGADFNANTAVMVGYLNSIGAVVIRGTR